jgi:hypothetical protein
MVSVILAGIVLIVLSATLLISADGNGRRAAKLLLLAVGFAALTLGGLFALESIERDLGSGFVVVLILFGILVGGRYAWSGFQTARRGSGTPSEALAVIAGVLMLLGIPYLLAGGYAAILGVLLFVLAAPTAGLSVLVSLGVRVARGQGRRHREAS